MSVKPKGQGQGNFTPHHQVFVKSATFFKESAAGQTCPMLETLQRSPLDRPLEVRYNQTMTQVAVKLPDDLKPFVDQSVKAGEFSDAGDFMVNLLYNIKAQSESELSEEQQAKLATLRAEIAIGVTQADAGDFVEFSAEEIIDAGRARRAAQLAS